MREQRKLQEWQREELKRTPFAILDEPPDELRPKEEVMAPESKHLANHLNHPGQRSGYI
jgi:hypothetical protein